MKKGVILVFLIFAGIFLVASYASAINIKVEKVSSNEVLVSGLDKPVVFDLKITNLGSGDSFSFYNLLGFRMFPVGTVPISNSEVKEVRVEVFPLSKLPDSGFYTFPYYIRGNDGSEISQNLTFKIIGLENAFEVGSADVDIEANTLEIYL